MKVRAALLLGLAILYTCYSSVSEAQVAEVTSELRIAIPYDIGKLDPLSLNEPVLRILLENLSIGLTERTATSSNLAYATGISIRDGGTRWIFELPRKGRFVSGRPITAHAVKEAYAYYLSRMETDPALAKLSMLKAAAVNVTSITANDPIEASATPSVEFRLRKPDPSFSETIPTLGILEMPIVASFKDSFGTGTQFSSAGPYYIRENRGDGLIILEMPNLLEDQLFRHQRVVLRQYPSPEQALKYMRSGEVDMILIPTVGLLQESENDPGIVRLSSAFEELKRLSGEWHPRKKYWGRETELNELNLHFFILRKSLPLDARMKVRFSFATCTPGCEPQTPSLVPKTTIPSGRTTDTGVTKNAEENE